MLTMLNLLTWIALFFLSSCALFKTGPSLHDSALEDVFKSVRVTGEGRGRLGVEQNNYLFSYEALINENPDWVLAVAVPLQGEEVMILRSIDKARSPESSPQSFEARVERELQQRVQDKELRKISFSKEVRSFIQFIKAPELGLKRTCESVKTNIYQCRLRKEVFEVVVAPNKVTVTKNLTPEHFFELSGENLTAGFFDKTNFHLKSHKLSSAKATLLSLELFWK